MPWDIEATDEFKGWFAALADKEATPIAVRLTLLREHGPALGYPYTSDIKGSKYGNMRELRIKQKAGSSVCSMLSTRVGRRSCCSLMTRLVMIDGTSGSSLGRQAVRGSP